MRVSPAILPTASSPPIPAHPAQSPGFPATASPTTPSLPPLRPIPPGATRIGRPYLLPHHDPDHPVHQLAGRPYVPGQFEFYLQDELDHDAHLLEGDCVIKLAGCPAELRLNWMRVKEAYPKYPLGASLAACIRHGLSTLDRDPRVRAFLTLARRIRGGAGLSLHDQYTMLSVIGWGQRVATTYSITPRIGQPSTWRVKLAEAIKAALFGRADLLGMTGSALGITCAAYALAKHELATPDFRAWAMSDFDALCTEVGNRAAAAERLLPHLVAEIRAAEAD